MDLLKCTAKLKKIQRHDDWINIVRTMWVDGAQQEGRTCGRVQRWNPPPPKKRISLFKMAHSNQRWLLFTIYLYTQHDQQRHTSGKEKKDENKNTVLCDFPFVPIHLPSKSFALRAVVLPCQTCFSGESKGKGNTDQSVCLSVCLGGGGGVENSVF